MATAVLAAGRGLTELGSSMHFAVADTTEVAASAAPLAAVRQESVAVPAQLSGDT